MLPLSQAAVVDEVEIGASRKVFDLRLSELGPYNIDFSRSGRYMLIGGQKGHLGLMDWQSGHTFCEVQVITAQASSHTVLQATQCLCAASLGHGPQPYSITNKLPSHCLPSTHMFYNVS